QGGHHARQVRRAASAGDDAAQTALVRGEDSLLSIVQMPKGVPVATFAIGEAGAANAGLLAMQILALHDAALAQRLADWRQAQTEDVLN
ncbi:AIR carboxylase family protein, partial [Paenibacillus polymyxa]|nr:AIR carboxylase family protein [Paenibacillus polymyxa]